jgi:hypothetical protein
MAVDSQTAPSQPGLVLVVGAPALRGPLLPAIAALGLAAYEADDPYSAMAELCRRPHEYGAMVLSLQGLYREELQIVTTVKRLYRNVEVWLADIDGRSAALAEGMRLGADGLLGEDGLHRLGGMTVVPPADAVERTPPSARVSPEPISTAVAYEAETPTLAHVTDSDRDGEGDRATISERLPLRSHGREPRRLAEPATADAVAEDNDAYRDVEGEPLLTADELRALLQDPQEMPPSGKT